MLVELRPHMLCAPGQKKFFLIKEKDSPVWGRWLVGLLRILKICMRKKKS